MSLLETKNRMITIFNEYSEHLQNAGQESGIVQMWEKDFQHRISCITLHETVLPLSIEDLDKAKTISLIISMQSFFKRAFDFLDAFYASEKETTPEGSSAHAFTERTTSELNARLAD